ncbi:hypothetical protein EVAR_67308_1 [Eumeta japonica]|uniref:Uncharacterized protein n=1 Tax=Eumeta variegata TaxID=151549 RepID=A0A4C1ZAL3_EUMVA|nr:hypothetical protein EVAR_67308_1 [Eumeta japonica]
MNITYKRRSNKEREAYRAQSQFIRGASHACAPRPFPRPRPRLRLRLRLRRYATRSFFLLRKFKKGPSSASELALKLLPQSKPDTKAGARSEKRTKKRRIVKSVLFYAQQQTGNGEYGE